MENIAADRGNTVRNCDTRHGVAVKENIVSDTGNSIRDCNTRHGVAAPESIVADIFDIFANGNIFQHITINSTVVSGRTHHTIRR